MSDQAKAETASDAKVVEKELVTKLLAELTALLKPLVPDGVRVTVIVSTPSSSTIGVASNTGQATANILARALTQVVDEDFVERVRISNEGG